jgi:predicted acyl esterase
MKYHVAAGIAAGILMFVMEFGLKGAARGYVVIIQDVRGRYESDGAWYPFKNESNELR